MILEQKEPTLKNKYTSLLLTTKNGGLDSIFWLDIVIINIHIFQRFS